MELRAVRKLLPLTLACVLGGCPSAAPPPKTAEPTKKLVVLMAVDQLPAWTFARHLSSFRGGFARLAKEGVVWTHGRYPYAATITALGHTALGTGAEPRRTGIAGNSWFDRSAGRWVDVTEDAAHLTVPPHPHDDGASPKYRLLEATGAGKKVLSLSHKERAAILMAPSHDAFAAWYEPNQAAFVTSTAYAPARPAWLDALAKEHPIAPRLETYTWTPLPETPSRALVPDDAPGETGKYGLGTKFPHTLAGNKKAAFAMGATPLSSDVLVEAVIAGIDAVKPELLDVSFSAHDLAAHAWGQESWEATDLLFRMDEAVGRMFDAFDARYGKDGWSLVMSADHGGPSMPERVGGMRVDVADVEQAIKASVGSDALDAIDERMIYVKQPDKIDAVVAAVKKVPGVGFVFRADMFASNAECKDLPDLERSVCLSIYPGRSGDILYGPTEKTLVMRRPFEADLHGTPYDYDREVPIIVREPHRAARVIDDEKPSTLRVAPTIARLLGVPPPPGAKEPPL